MGIGKDRDMTVYVILEREYFEYFFILDRNPPGIKDIPNHSNICIRANANQSEKRFQSRLLKNA